MQYEYSYPSKNKPNEEGLIKMKIETVIDVIKSFLDTNNEGENMNPEFLREVFAPLSNMYLKIKDWET